MIDEIAINMVELLIELMHHAKKDRCLMCRELLKHDYGIDVE